MPSTVFDLSATSPNGAAFPLAPFQGRVLLIVNTATECGFTPQFAGLEALHKAWSDKGLTLLGFPCNQFAFQEPVKDAEMVEVCRINHGVTFPLMAKSDVNGPRTNPVFKFLKDRDQAEPGQKVKWNFTKFLVARDGTTVRRYRSEVEPAALEADLKALLGV